MLGILTQCQKERSDPQRGNRRIVFDASFFALAIGYGLFRGANSLLYATALADVPFPSLFIPDITFTVTSAAGGLLFAMALALLAWRGVVRSFRLPVLVPAALLFFAIVGPASAGVLDFAPWASVGFALAYGIASTCLSIAWLEVLAHQDMPRIAVSFAMAMMLKSIVSLLFSGLTGAVLVLAAGVALCVSSILLVCGRRAAKAEGDDQSCDAEPAGGDGAATLPSKARAYWAGFMGMADAVAVSVVLEAIIGVLNGFYVGSATVVAPAGLADLGGAVAAVAFCLMVLFVARIADIEKVYRYLFPFLLAVVLLLPLFSGEGAVGSFLQAALVAVYQFIAFSALYFVLRQLRRSGLSTYVLASCATALARGAQIASGAAGYELGGASADGSGGLIWIAVVVSVYGLSILLLYLTRRRRRPVEKQVIVLSEDDRFALRAHELAGTHRLTAREEEILLQLARGRSAAFIADDLVCSPATVRTHTKSIYAKLNVHSKQELIDLFA